MRRRADRGSGVSEVGRLSALLSTFDSSAPALTLLQVAPGVRMMGPPVEGVIAMLVLTGTMFLEIGDAPPIVVRQGELVLVPAGRRSYLAASDRTRSTIDGAAMPRPPRGLADGGRHQRA